MNFKKSLTSLAAIAAIATPIITTISCGPKKAGNKNPWAKNKEIVIAVDGAQKKMYDDVVKQFNKTASHTQGGFKIKFIQKDAFGAIDLATTLGYTDENVPDLIYAPQDRVTGLIQQKAAMPWTNKMRDDFLTGLGATDEEKKWTIGYGSLMIGNKNTFFAMPHNKEGIALISAKSKPEVAKDLNGDKLNTLLKMADKGEGLFRIQDFWYGNGILGGVLGANSPMLGQLLYKKDSKWTSGFLKNNENHTAFEKAERLAADLYYNPWKSAYGNGYETSQYKKKGISQGDLQAFVNSNVGAAQNKIFQLLQDKKINYAFSGTWDLTNASNKGIDTYLNMPKIDKQTPFIQAPGSWSYVINARNNGVGSDRINAIMEVMKGIYSKQGYYDYFKSDSKIPLFKTRKIGVEEFSNKEGSAIKTKINNIAKEYKENDSKKFITEFNSAFGVVNKMLVGINVINDWSFGQEDPLADTAMASVDTTKLPKVGAFVGLDLPGNKNLKEQYEKILSGDSFSKYTGIRNAMAALSGETLKTLVGGDADKTIWKVNPALYNDGKKIDKSAWADKENLHVRKLGKLIFGVDGDNGDDKAKVVANILKNGYDAVYKEAYAKAVKFINTFVKKKPKKAIIKKAVDGYLGNYKNQAVIQGFINKYKKALKTINYNTAKAKGTHTYLEIAAIIRSLNKSKLFNSIFNVVTSTKKFDGINSKALGTMDYQTKRFDHYNPQFGGVWTLWNEQTFGNIVWLKSIETKGAGLSKKQFEDVIVQHLDELYAKKTKVLDATTGSTDFIIMTDE